MDTFSTSQVAKRFGVADQTVKNWASEFAPYLSPTATPETGKRRAFTAEDVSVFALVHSMVGRGRDTDAAHAALQAGQRGTVNALAMAQNGDNLIVVQRERDMLQGAVATLREQLEGIERQLEAEREGRRADTARMTEAHKQELLQLQYKLVGRVAELEMIFQMIKDGRLKPEDI